MAETPEVDLRGHISIPLDGQEFVLRPSFEAIKRIEERLNLSHEHLANLSVQQRLSYEQLAVICCEMMRAQGEANPSDPLRTHYLGAKPEKLEKLIYQTGKVRINVRVSVVLTAALSGGYTPEGEPIAAEETNTEATPAAE